MPPAPPVGLTFGTTEENLRSASDYAAINLLTIQDAVQRRLLDSNSMTIRQLIDLGEHAYKVSGMQKRQEVKDDGGKFIFNIVMGDGQSVTIEKTVEGEVVDTVETLVAEAPRFDVTLPFPVCPEFSAAEIHAEAA